METIDMERRRGRRVAAAAGLLALLPACGGGARPKAVSTPTPKRTIVNVRLQEYAVIPAVASAPAGFISFQPKNTGPKLTHEFVVVKTSLAPGALPTKTDGSVDLKSSAVTVEGSIRAIPVGSTGARTFTLAPGHYVLFCNLVKGTVVHYKLGMRTAFTVT